LSGPAIHARRSLGEAVNAFARRLITAVVGRTSYAWLQRRWYQLNESLPWTAFHYRRTKAFAEKFGLTVRRGPFSGLRYPEASVGRVPLLVQRLLGSYEAELHEVIEELISDRYDTVVNIGAAEGYYAVGLALRLPEATVFAFDIDPAARAWCRKIARENNVDDRVQIGARFDAALLGSVNAKTALVVDCEGCESEVLVPDQAHVLRSSKILVELHENKRPGVTAEVLRRFSSTHATKRIASQNRERALYPELEQFSASDASAMLWERPYPMEWAVLSPRSAMHNLGETVLSSA
jgi:hypothetical protein